MTLDGLPYILYPCQIKYQCTSIFRISMPHFFPAYVHNTYACLGRGMTIYRSAIVNDLRWSGSFIQTSQNNQLFNQSSHVNQGPAPCSYIMVYRYKQCLFMEGPIGAYKHVRISGTDSMGFRTLSCNIP